MLIAFLALYILSQGSAISIIFGALAFFMLIILLVMEFVISGKEEGFRKSMVEIVVAIAIIAALWISLRFILNTNDPIDVVPSCSMLPALQRGDLIVLQGISPSEIKAPVINVSKAAFDSMTNNIRNESLVCLYYTRNGNSGSVSQFERPGSNLGLFRFTGNSYEQVSSQPSGSLVRYQCGAQPVRFSNGTVTNEAYTKSITINGTTVNENLNNSIVVYRTIPQDYFYSLGDAFIVHRAYAMLNVSGDYYVLTKGDNNPALDMQYLNYPPSFSYLSGVSILSIPYLGYLKIIISGQLLQPSGCNSTVVH